MASGLFPNVNDLEKAASSFYKRLLIAEQYSLNHNLQSPVHLLKAEDSKLQSTDSDYGLSQVCSGRLEIELVPGNHETFVQGGNAAVTANCFVMCNHGIPRCD